MELQTLFYIMGIIFMTVVLILLITFVVVAFYIRKKVNQFQREMELISEYVKELTKNPVDTARNFAKVIAAIGLRRFIRSSKPR